MPRSSPLLLLLLLSALAPPQIRGASFRALPTRVELDARSKTGVVRLINEGQEPLSLQLKGVVWTQDEHGADQFAPTDRLIFFPKIVTLKPAEERIVRLAYQGTVAAEELTFRMFVEELPVAKPGVTGLQVALRIGIPVFFKSVEQVKEWSLAGMTVADGVATVLVRNGGNSHLIVTSMIVKAVDGAQQPLFSGQAKGWYVLPGKTVPFRVPLPPQHCPNVRELTAEVAVDVEKDKESKTLVQAVKLQPDQCTPKPEAARPTPVPNPP